MKEKDTFSKVAEENQLSNGFWKCADCGKILRNLRPHNFAHIKPKGKYPELKYDPKNIKIKCYVCHSNNDHHQGVNRESAQWLDN